MQEPIADIKFSLPSPETIALSAQTVEQLIKTGDGDAALLYLYVLKTHGHGTVSDAAAALRKDTKTISSAMAVLSRLGLVTCAEDAAPAPKAAIQQQEPRRYTADEITSELRPGSDFSFLVEEVQRSLGKILSSDDLERLLSIYNGLNLPSDVILQLVTHCITVSRERGNGRMPPMKYIEKAAYTWESEGIFSLDRAEEYLKALDFRKSERGKKKALHTTSPTQQAGGKRADNRAFGKEGYGEANMQELERMQRLRDKIKKEEE